MKINLLMEELVPGKYANVHKQIKLMPLPYGIFF
jgi:hypothetical protein